MPIWHSSWIAVVSTSCLYGLEIDILPGAIERQQGGVNLDINIEDSAWAGMTHEEKNQVLFQKQKEMLDLLLERGAISQEQHDKSLHDLTEKMNPSK